MHCIETSHQLIARNIHICIFYISKPKSVSAQKWLYRYRWPWTVDVSGRNVCWPFIEGEPYQPVSVSIQFSRSYVTARFQRAHGLTGQVKLELRGLSSFSDKMCGYIRCIILCVTVAIVRVIDSGAYLFMITDHKAFPSMGICNHTKDLLVYISSYLSC